MPLEHRKDLEECQKNLGRISEASQSVLRIAKFPFLTVDGGGGGGVIYGRILPCLPTIKTIGNVSSPPQEDDGGMKHQKEKRKMEIKNKKERKKERKVSD